MERAAGGGEYKVGKGKGMGGGRCCSSARNLVLKDMTTGILPSRRYCSSKYEFSCSSNAVVSVAILPSVPDLQIVE